MKTLIAVLLVLVPSQALAQEAPNFLYLRTGSSSAILANYNRTFDGNKVVWFGTLQDLTIDPDYREVQMGLGRILGSSQVFGIVVRASDSWYLEPAVVPSINWKKFSITGFVAVYVPLQAQGVKQFLVDPISGLVKINSKVSAGASYTLLALSGFRKDAVGPTLQLSVPKGSLNIDLFEGLTNYKREVRITLQLAF